MSAFIKKNEVPDRGDQENLWTLLMMEISRHNGSYILRMKMYLLNQSDDRRLVLSCTQLVQPSHTRPASTTFVLKNRPDQQRGEKMAFNYNSEKTNNEENPYPAAARDKADQ